MPNIFTDDEHAITRREFFLTLITIGVTAGVTLPTGLKAALTTASLVETGATNYQVTATAIKKNLKSAPPAVQIFKLFRTDPTWTKADEALQRALILDRYSEKHNIRVTFGKPVPIERKR